MVSELLRSNIFDSLTDRAFIYTRIVLTFYQIHLYQVGRSLASASLLTARLARIPHTARSQELYAGADDGAHTGAADTSVPADRSRRGIQRQRGAIGRP